MKEQIHNKREMLERRKKLRNNATQEEKLLWKYLRKSYVADAKFRRQHSVGYYVLDFYCPEVRLAVELDGGGHYTEEVMEYDKTRDEYLKALNIKTIRFNNRDVKNNMTGILDLLGDEIENRRGETSTQATTSQPLTSP